jgi:hypothetical protein
MWQDGKIDGGTKSIFFQTQVPSVKRNKTEVPKNKVFKPQAPNMYLTLMKKPHKYLPVNYSSFEVTETDKILNGKI